MPSPFNRCIKVRIKRSLLETKPELVQQMFWQAIPIRIDHEPYDDSFTYFLIGPAFAGVEDGLEPEDHIAVFKGERFVGFERRWK